MNLTVMKRWNASLSWLFIVNRIYVFSVVIRIMESGSFTIPSMVSEKSQPLIHSQVRRHRIKFDMNMRLMNST